MNLRAVGYDCRDWINHVQKDRWRAYKVYIRSAQTAPSERESRQTADRKGAAERTGYPGPTVKHYTHWDNGQTPVPVQKFELNPPDFTTWNRIRATLIRSPARYLKTKKADKG
ncbi:hypothetical protein ANN_15313 [Periplaneta americana]|uniref:Uncharacterized protein n=1 Tax=Periplaneta americana TaxID=6978 RepID=A0ABQ8SH74_PERAM|nr:hypothetical protein ANN_15313 [Periplaneta americana]